MNLRIFILPFIIVAAAVFGSVSVAAADSSPPVLNPIGDKVIAAGQPLQFTVSGSDTDSDPLLFSASNLPSGASFNSSNQSFSWTPKSEQIGRYTNVHFEVFDGVNTVDANIAIVVLPPGSAIQSPSSSDNLAPVLDKISDKYATAGQMLQFMVSATDANFEPLTYTASNLPPGAVFNSATRTFAWTPTEEQIGNYPDVSFDVSDGSLTDSETMSITVNSSVNTKPSIDNLQFSEIKTDSAVVHWTTDTPGSSQIEYWTGFVQATPLDNNLVTDHTVQLNGLVPGTVYHYHALSVDNTGKIWQSKDMEFTTPQVFSVYNLTITPSEAKIGETVSISGSVINNTNASGSAELVLRVGGSPESTNTVTLAAGEKKQFSFTTVRNSPGNLSIDVNGATGSLIVINAPLKDTPLWLKATVPSGFVAVVCVIATGVFIRRRRSFKMG